MARVRGGGEKVLGRRRLIFKVVHFLIAVIMMQNQAQVATEEAYSGRKSQSVSCAALRRTCAGRSASAWPCFAYDPLFSFKARQFYLPLRRSPVASTALAFTARRNNKWSAQIKSAVALSIFQAGHAFLFIHRVKAGRSPPAYRPPSQLSLFI